MAGGCSFLFKRPLGYHLFWKANASKAIGQPMAAFTLHLFWAIVFLLRTFPMIRGRLAKSRLFWIYLFLVAAFR